jgi:hypothetical protein
MSRVLTSCSAWVIAGLAAAWVAPASAQYPGHVDDQKQQAGAHLRATAVLEYTGDLKQIKESRLVPIAIWDGAQYQPGGLYLAQPAPLAVLSGTQYELEAAGKPQGFFNVRDSEDLAGLWVGVGSFEAPPSPKPKAPPSRSNHVYEVGAVDPDKPHFAHRPKDESENGSDAGSGASAGSGNGSAAGAQSAPPVDPDRPTLHPRAGGSDAGGAGAGSAGSNQPDADADRPTFHRQSNGSGQMQADQPAVDPDRPRLEYKAPQEQAKLAKPDALFGLPPDMNQMAGVSDNRNGDTLSWTFSWANADDANKMKSALEEIAQKAIAPAAPPATPAPSKTAAAAGAHRKLHQPPPPPLPALTDEDFRVYSLSFGGGATMVLTARSTATPAKYVTIVAEPDFYGNPKVLLQQVTSDASLDVSPRYRLVDAVDTAGNGRADLIFELRGQTYRQFAIYRIAGGTATQVFTTQPTAN